MTFAELLASLGEQLGGTSELSPEATGCIHLDIDGMPVTIIGLEDIGQVVLSGVIGTPPPEQHLERLYLAMLKANHNFKATGGATISVNPDDGNISLCRSLTMALLDGDSFFAEMGRFVNILDAWRRLVQDFHSQCESSDGTIETTEEKESLKPLFDTLLRV